ncbi:MAG: hypothetical protein GY903_06055 [Fuerstiella sp.]|nr:hypothetical protein [Fuerstiella sp.]
MTEFLTGDKALDRALKEIGGKVAEKSIASGVRAGLGEMRKAMRAATPNSSAKKVIKARFKRKKKLGLVEAKVGAGVGKYKAHSPTNGGVGISQRSAPLYFYNRKHRRGRGVMPTVNAIPIGAATSRASALLKLQQKTRQVLEKEAAKLGRR